MHGELYISLSRSLSQIRFLKNNFDERAQIPESTSIAESTESSTVRLEATCGYRIYDHQFFVAISVQYISDPLGNIWQVFRPCIILDSSSYQLLYDFELTARPDSLFSLLGSFVNLGMHDYVHGSVMKWFPPPEHVQFTDEYRSIHSETTGPPELDAWHLFESVPMPSTFGSEVLRSEILPLEFYSFVVHRQVMDRIIFDAPANYRMVRSSALYLGTRLARLLEQDRIPNDMAIFLLSLAARFLVCCIPIEKAVKYLSEELPRPFRELAQDYLLTFLHTAHGGLLSQIHELDGHFVPWGGRMVRTDLIRSTYLDGVAQYAASEIAQDLKATRSLYGRSVDEVPSNFARLAILALEWLKLRDRVSIVERVESDHV